MATISTRAKSPTRAEAIARALRPGPVFNTGVLLGKSLRSLNKVVYKNLAIQMLMILFLETLKI